MTVAVRHYKTQCDAEEGGMSSFLGMLVSVMVWYLEFGGVGRRWLQSVAVVIVY